MISALTDGTVTISATITDSAGNSSTQTHNVVVNTASVALTVNTLSGDDVINAAEAGNALVINGSSAQFASGTQVTVTLNGKNYTATIQNDGSGAQRYRLQTWAHWPMERAIKSLFRRGTAQATVLRQRMASAWIPRRQSSALPRFPVMMF